MSSIWSLLPAIRIEWLCESLSSCGIISLFVSVNVLRVFFSSLGILERLKARFDVDKLKIGHDFSWCAIDLCNWIESFIVIYHRHLKFNLRCLCYLRFRHYNAATWLVDYSENGKIERKNYFLWSFTHYVAFFAHPLFTQVLGHNFFHFLRHLFRLFYLNLKHFFSKKSFPPYSSCNVPTMMTL